MRTEIRRVHLQSDAFEGGDVRVLAASQKAEEERISNHSLFFSAKEEGATETVVIVTTLTRQGNLADKVEGFENDVVATQRSLAADQELAAASHRSGRNAERVRLESSSPHQRGLYDDDALELQSSFSDPISVAGTQEHRGVHEVQEAADGFREIRRPTSGHGFGAQREER